MDDETGLPRLRFRWHLSRHLEHPKRLKQIVRWHLQHVWPQRRPTRVKPFRSLCYSVRLFVQHFVDHSGHLTYPGIVGPFNDFGL